MKLIVFLSLVALAYSYSVSYGIGKNINVQKDGTVAIWSPLGKRIVLANVLGITEPRYIDVVVEHPLMPTQKYQIDTMTGLPVRVHPYNLGETIKVINFVEGKKILNEMLEGLLTQEIMTHGEELYQTGILHPVIYNLLKMWEQQQYVQPEIYPTFYEQMKNIIRKQQQEEILPAVYQQEVESMIPYVKYGQQVPVLPQHQYQNVLLQLQQQVPLHQILAQLQQTPLEKIQHVAMLQRVLSQHGQTVLLPWEAQLLLQLQQQKAIIEQDIQGHYQQGHHQIVLIELQQWKQLQEQEEDLLEQIHLRAYGKGNILNLMTMPTYRHSYQYQPFGLQQEYIRSQQQVVPQQELVQFLLGRYGQKYGYESKYGQGYGQRFGGITEQMVFPQETVY